MDDLPDHRRKALLSVGDTRLSEQTLTAGLLPSLLRIITASD